MAALIDIDGISRHYQMGPTTVKAIDGVSFGIAEGEFVSIIGPSGSGKSTLMNIIGCLDSPTGGTYRLAGTDVSRMDSNSLAGVRNRYIGFVFQTFNLLGRESALENVELPLVYAGIPPKERKERALEMLERVGLGDRSDHVPNQLSGGQRQRVAIARALAGKPKLLLADEPTGALDTRTGIEIMKLFHELNTEGVTLVMVTHDNDLARQAKRVVQIRDGKVLQDVPAEEFEA
ncbi:macrolide ABC transporter ATP-binding protein [Marispirochaeta aestuarii]|uniref:Macrolide ABC transporter ATP-binding protein n=1 Tax=Marispirochaeta aestuarii TaxID=1963862 RepID=A0A1Y1RVE0_9SPIO|nr:ABC transporter ATP-binding protein [Marispirochaeta aestuarii]ORC32603.1 macrolide ABC transporter ATP-binding protein [Marispirochaeta aestuarii]